MHAMTMKKTIHTYNIRTYIQYTYSWVYVTEQWEVGTLMDTQHSADIRNWTDLVINNRGG